MEKWLSRRPHKPQIAWFESRLRYQAPWSSGCARRPVKAEVTGSNPVGVARMFAGVVYRPRLESAWVEMPRGFESHSILQEMWLSGLKHSPRKRAGSNASWVRIPPSPPGMAAIGAAHRLESGWAARLCGFDSHPFLQAWSTTGRSPVFQTGRRGFESRPRFHGMWRN